MDWEPKRQPKPQHSDQRISDFVFRADSIRFPPLQPARSAEQFGLHMAALEWTIDAPITISSAADIQSKRIWEGRFKPYAHQVRNLITFCRRAPVALFADDVGLGKTISAGLVLSELMERRKVTRALVVAPRILLPQWQEELGVKFDIPSEAATGAELAGAVIGKMPVVITTYQSLRNQIENLSRSDFDMVILDEAHKLRNLHGTSKAPEFAQGIRQALEGRVFKYVLMLTATPIQNRLWDLYSLVDLLTVAKGHENPFGTPDVFRAHYVADVKAVKIKHGRKEQFRRHLAAYIVRTRRSDAKLVFPTRNVKTQKVLPERVELELLELIGELLRSRTLNGLTQSSVGQALMSSPAALVAQLEEMARRGTVPISVARAASALVGPEVISGKLNGLAALVRELSEARPKDWRLVVFTSRSKTQEMIGRHLKMLGIPVGFIAGGRAAENERSIRAFRKKSPEVRVLISTDAGAEGINLQVANVLVNYDLPWNPMVLEQRIGRIQRLASDHAEVNILNLVLKGSVEELVVGRLGEKLQAISESIGDIEGILETAWGADGADDTFESMIRKLVVDSLMGMDVQNAMRKAMASIKEAQEIYEAERKTVDQTLGDLEDWHRVGAKVPNISSITPSISAEDFVLGALRADGASIEVVEEEILRVILPGKARFLLTFDPSAVDYKADEAVMSGNRPRLFLPGKRDFERLAQNWADKSGSLIVDRSLPSVAEIEEAVARWLTAFPHMKLTRVTEKSREADGFDGELTCLASVAVAHDRLEKLVTVSVCRGPKCVVDPPQALEQFSKDHCESRAVGDGLEEIVTAAIQEEPDLAVFADFYSKRLAEELVSTADDIGRRGIRERFTPAIGAESVAVRGVRHTVIQVAVSVLIDGKGPYETRAVVRTARTPFQVEAHSDWIQCAETGLDVPVAATGDCAISKVRALLHLMEVSPVSGRRALVSLMVQCEETGCWLLPDEVDTCVVTGKRVRRGLLLSSALSGRAALPGELVECEFTGSNVLPDELAVSEVSDRRYRIDQTAQSVLSKRRGHESEFVFAAVPAGFLVIDEASRSAVSGRWGSHAALMSSEVSPERLGLPDELVRSAVSGRLGLIDEIDRSAVSAKPALSSEFERCAITGGLCLPEELASSEVSGRRFRLDQMCRSALSTRIGHESEFVESFDPPGLICIDEAAQSAASGAWSASERFVCSAVAPYLRALPHEMISSVLSGALMLPHEGQWSPVSDRPALPTEFARCEVTGDAVLPDELVSSAISGRRFRHDQLATSVVSGRVGHRSEFVDSMLPKGTITHDEAERSVISGVTAARSSMVQSRERPTRWALPEETIASVVSGEILLKDEAVFSSLGGGPAAQGELAPCEFTGETVLPCELLDSHVSGKRFRKDQAAVSEESGRIGHSSEFVLSVLPKGLIAQDEAAASALSGRYAARVAMFVSAAPSGRIGLPDEFTISAVSGRRYLRDEIIRSAVSGESAGPGELSTCAFTGALVLPSELVKSDVSQKLFRRDEMTTSVVSGRKGHASEFMRSASPWGQIAVDEAARSDLSGEWGARSDMKASDRPPHRIGFSHQIAECELSRRRLLRDELEPSSNSGRMVDSELLVASDVSGLRALPEEMFVCEATGRRLLPREVGVCAITSRRMDRRELKPSAVSGRDGSAVLMVKCEETNQLVFPSELGQCTLSGRVAIFTELMKCCLTDRIALRRLLKTCPSTGSAYIDDFESAKATKNKSRFKELLGTCVWTGRRQLSVRLGTCTLTGLVFERELLNPAGEVAMLRTILDEDVAAGSSPVDASVTTWLRAAHEDFKSTQEARGFTNATGTVSIAMVRVKSGFLGLGTTIYAIVIGRATRLEFLCAPLAGKRLRGGWDRVSR